MSAENETAEIPKRGDRPDGSAELRRIKRPTGGRDDDDEVDVADVPKELANPDVIAQRNIVRVKRDVIVPSAAAPAATGLFGALAASPVGLASATTTATSALPKSGLFGASAPDVPNVFNAAFSFSFKAPTTDQAAPLPAASHVFGSASATTSLSFASNISAPAASRDDGAAEEGEDDAQAEVAIPNGGDKSTPLLTGVTVDNGESNDATVFTGDFRLHALVDGDWKERGSGYLRLNVPKGEESDPQSGRIIIRGTATKAVLLHSALKKPAFKIVQVVDRCMKFTCVADGKVTTFLLRAAKGAPDDTLTRLHAMVQRILDRSPSV